MPHSSETIKIVYLIDFFGTGGGTENQLALLIRNLDRSRFTPFLFTLRSKEHYHHTDLNCQVMHLDVHSLLSVRAIRALWQFIRFLKRNHVAILQLFFFDSNIFGVLAGRLAPVPSIIISRRDMGWWYHQKRLYLTNLLNRMAHYCIANAEAVKGIVNKMETIPTDQTRVIYNGVSACEPNTNPTLTRSFFQIPETVPVVGIVANLKPIKRIDRFLRAVAHLKRTDGQFIILGCGIQQAELENLAHGLGLSSRVHFHHTVDQARDVINLFDIGVLTSESEGLSNVLIEYALAGIPAVAFDTGGNNEVIVDGQTGYLIADFDEAAMAEKIDYLIENGVTARRFGMVALERARQKFTVETMVEKTEEFYLEILKRGYQSAPI